MKAIKHLIEITEFYGGFGARVKKVVCGSRFKTPSRYTIEECTCIDCLKKGLDQNHKPEIVKRFNDRLQHLTQSKR